MSRYLNSLRRVQNNRDTSEANAEQRFVAKEVLGVCTSDLWRGELCAEEEQQHKDIAYNCPLCVHEE